MRSFDDDGTLVYVCVTLAKEDVASQNLVTDLITIQLYSIYDNPN